MSVTPRYYYARKDSDERERKEWIMYTYMYMYNENAFKIVDLPDRCTVREAYDLSNKTHMQLGN